MNEPAFKYYHEHSSYNSIFNTDLELIFIKNSYLSKANMTSNQFIGSMALVVKDYDEAIEFYKNKLGFELVHDEVLSPKKRWVLVRPPSINPGPSTSCCLLLAKADGDIQEASIGNQTGGRVFLFLHTDDFWRDFNKYKEKGVKFIREPLEQSYGIVAVFEDLYGNKWDLVQMKSFGIK